MAINLQDQQRVSLGGSSVSPHDTFSAPGIDRGAERNAEALARSLEGFGNTLQAAGSEARARENKADELRRAGLAASLVDSLNNGEAADVALGRIAPNLSYLNRVATQQAAGQLLGNRLAEESLLNFPEGMTDQPEKLAAWYAGKRQELAAQYKDNPFIQAGVIETLNDRFTRHQATMFARANADAHATQTTAFTTSVDNILDTTVPPKRTPDAVRVGATPPPSPSFGYSVNTGAAPNRGAASAVVTTANSLGINPYDLATLISYETAGRFDPNIRGGKNNAHVGLIQFGAWEQKKYGIRKGMSFEEQMGAVAAYLKDRGAKPGDDLLTLYKIVNGGNRNVSGKASDGNGTIEQHVAKMRLQHAANAAKFLTGSADERLVTASGRPVDETGSIKSPNMDENTIFDEDEPDHIIDNDVLALRTNLLQLDQQSNDAANPQMTRRERKKIMLGAVIRKATETRDARFLYALPETMLDAEEREMIKATREQITALKIRDYEFKRKMAKDREEDERDNNINTVLADIAAGKTVDALTDPRIVIGGKRDPKMVQLIAQVTTMPRVAPVISQNRIAEVTAAVEAWAGSQNTAGLAQLYGIKGGDVERKLRDAIAADPNINASDKAGLVSSLSNTISQSAKVNDPIVKNSYTVGGIVNTAMQGPFGKILPPTLGANMENLFRTRVQSGIRSWYSGNPGRTITAADLQAIADEANTFANNEFNKLYQMYTKAGGEGGTPQFNPPPALKREVRPDGTIVFSQGK